MTITKVTITKRSLAENLGVFLSRNGSVLVGSPAVGSSSICPPGIVVGYMAQGMGCSALKRC